MLLGFVGEFDGKILSCNIRNVRKIERELENTLCVISQFAFLQHKANTDCEIVYKMSKRLLESNEFDLSDMVEFMGTIPVGISHSRLATAVGKETELFRHSGVILTPKFVCLTVFLLEAITVLVKYESDYNCSFTGDWMRVNKYYVRVLQVALNAVCINMGSCKTNLIRLLLGESPLQDSLDTVGFEFNDTSEVVSWGSPSLDLSFEKPYTEYYNKLLTVGLQENGYCNAFYQLFFAMLDSGDRVLHSIEKTAIASAAGVTIEGDLLSTILTKGMSGFVSEEFPQKFISTFEGMLEDALYETRGWGYVKEVQFKESEDAILYGSLVRKLMMEFSEDDKGFLGLF